MGFRQRYAYTVIVMLLVLAAAAAATGPHPPTTRDITGADDLASENLMPLDQAPIRPPRQSPGSPGDTGSGLPIRL